MRAIPVVVFNIFFAAVLTIVLHRLSEGTVILAELAHLKEPRKSVGPDSATGRTTFVVRCEVCCTRMAPA